MKTITTPPKYDARVVCPACHETVTARSGETFKQALIRHRQSRPLCRGKKNR